MLVFLVLVALWCLIARVIGTREAVTRAVERAGDAAIPVVLIALGVYILAESGLLQRL